LRAYRGYLSFALLWSFIAAAQAPGLHPLNVGIASVSGIVGFLSGAINTRGTIRGIEKKGEYHASRNRLLLLLGIGLVIIAVFVYVADSGWIPWSILQQLMSTYAAIPAIYLGAALIFRRWELKNGKEIQWEGTWTGTFYAIPKGLTWQERYQYRYERDRLRLRNLAEEAATNKP